MIEGADHRQVGIKPKAVIKIGQCHIRLKAQSPQHGDQQNGFVFAIAKAVLDHLGGKAGKVPSGPNFDTDIAHFALHQTQGGKGPRRVVCCGLPDRRNLSFPGYGYGPGG